MLKIDIYWDLRYTMPEHHTGVGQHVIEVLNGLRAHPDCDLRVLVAKDQFELWAEQSKVYDWEALEIVILPLSNKGNRLCYGLTSIRSLDPLCAGRDLVYSPMELLLGFKHIPFVNTMHGIPCFEESLPSELYGSLRYRWERLKQAWFFRRCRRLCCRSFAVSDYLKVQLQERFNFDSEMLHTVYNGARDGFFEQQDPQNTANAQRPPRFLAVGGANAFDGAADLVRIARVLQRDMPEAKIWIAGDRHEEPWSGQLHAMENVGWHGFLSSEQMMAEMQKATALLYVPAVESFGIIGVEAMAVGLPILAHQNAALEEVLRDAALWIDPANASTLAESLRAIVEDADLREKLIGKGRKQAVRYTWPAVVERVLSGFQQIAATI
jgi:glycosyltransferase involved in cell wall biosynthesis